MKIQESSSSNVNEVISAVLNSLFFFTKRFCTHQKHQKHHNAPKAPKSTQSTKKHKTRKDATKQKHKTLQANSKGMVDPLHQ